MVVAGGSGRTLAQHRVQVLVLALGVPGQSLGLLEANLGVDVLQRLVLPGSPPSILGGLAGFPHRVPGGTFGLPLVSLIF